MVRNRLWGTKSIHHNSFFSLAYCQWLGDTLSNKKLE